MRSLRNHRTPYVQTVRPLTPQDLGALREPARRPQVQKLRDAHHNVARLLSLGLSQIAVASRTGYSIARVNQLAADPAMQELIATYRGTIDESFAEKADIFADLAVGDMIKAERRLSEKLDDEDTDLSVRELLAVVADRADRFGYQKKTTNVNVNIDFAARLEAAIARSSKTIESRANEVD